MQDLISIIIPVYNVNPYLHECLKSVINQTYKNLEILVIDDGSTDGSAEICDEYAVKDLRIKVIHKINGGVSSARNVGIKLFQGDYLIFVDGDDAIDENYCQILYELFLNHNCDVAYASIKSIDKLNNKESIRGINCKNSSFYDDFYYLYTGENRLLIGTAGGKMLKRTIIKKYNLCFDEKLKNHEDLKFMLTYYQYVRQYSASLDTSYNYYKRGRGSATETFSFSRINDEHIALILIKNWLDKQKISNKGKILTYDFVRMVNDTVVALKKSNLTESDKYDIFRESLKDNMPIIAGQFTSVSLKQTIIILLLKIKMEAIVYCYYKNKS